MDAAAIDEWKGYARLERRQRLVETQVVLGAVVTGLLLAVIERGVRDQVEGAEVAVDLHSRQIELVRRRASFGITVDEAVLPWVRVHRPVGRDVVQLAVLVIDARRHLPGIVHRPKAR